MSKATEAELSHLHNVVAKNLADAIEGKEAPAALLAAAITFLKNNNITCTPAEDNALGELAAIMAARRKARAPVEVPDFHADLPEGMH